MYRHNIGYRHDNGEAQGFTGYGFTRAAAESRALDNVRQHCERIEKTFRPAAIIREPSQASPAELATIRADWATN